MTTSPILLPTAATPSALTLRPTSGWKPAAAAGVLARIMAEGRR